MNTSTTDLAKLLSAPDITPTVTRAHLIELLVLIQAKNGQDNAKHYLADAIARRASECKASPEATRKLAFLTDYSANLPQSVSIHLSASGVDLLASDLVSCGAVNIAP